MRPMFLTSFFVLLTLPAHSQNQINATNPKLDLLSTTPFVAEKVKFLPESSLEPIVPFENQRHQARFNRLVFFSGVAALGSAKAYDAVTTRSALQRGGWENNPVYGRHPSVALQAAVNAAFFTGESVLFYATEHSRRQWIRWSGRIALMFSIEEDLRLGACNSKTFHNCHPLTPF